MTATDRKIIAVDIDDVLASFNEAMRLFINKHYGLNHSKADYDKKGKYWRYWETIWGVSDIEGLKRHKAFIKSKAIRRLKLHDGAIDVIKRLEKSYKLVIITARNDEHLEDTHHWLEKHFPGVFDQVLFAKVWERNMVVTKATICQEIGASYLLDDNAEHCNLAAEAGIQALMFGDYGWNRAEKLHKNVIRLKDWHAVAEYFGV